MAFDFNSLDRAFFMCEAPQEARLAIQAGGRPMGAVVVLNHVVFALVDHWINPLAMPGMPHVRRPIYNYVGGVLEEESEALWQQCSLDELMLIREGSKSSKL